MDAGQHPVSMSNTELPRAPLDTPRLRRRVCHDKCATPRGARAAWPRGRQTALAGNDTGSSEDVDEGRNLPWMSPAATTRGGRVRQWESACQNDQRGQGAEHRASLRAYQTGDGDPAPPR